MFTARYALRPYIRQNTILRSEVVMKLSAVAFTNEEAVGIEYFIRHFILIKKRIFLKR
jgi:hypothetical protein